MSTIYVAKPKGDSTRRYNTSGTAFVVNEFVVLAGMCLKALEAIANAAVGAFEKLKGEIIEVSDYVSASEDTFATANLPVYWDPTTGKFSDTKTVGYYLVGYTIAPISGTVIEVEVCDPVLVPTFAALADVSAASPTNNDTLKYVASTSKWTVVAVAD